MGAVGFAAGDAVRLAVEVIMRVAGSVVVGVAVAYRAT